MYGSSIELYVSKILEFSSQYGSEIGSSYNILNLIDKPTIYPNYGDFSNAAVFRTYGTFWINCSSKLKDIYSIAIPKNNSEDFVEFSIKYPIIVNKFEIYETYNPGSIERVYFFLPEGWTMMWHRSTEENSFTLKESRIFTPNIKSQFFPCDKFRIEVNQSNCDYYSEFDAIKDSTANKESVDSICGQDYISYLPEEILINIFSYFQLKTLSKIASVSRRFLLSVDQALKDIREINFRNVWSKLDYLSLIWIGNKCSNLTRVDLSWCGKNPNFTLFGLCHFLTLIGAQLKTLRFSACSAVNDVVLRSIVKNCPQLEDLDLSSCVNISSHSFSDLRHLTNIKYLNLYRTNVDSNSIELAVESWKNLLHLNLGSCIKIDKWNEVIKLISIHCHELISIDLWRSNINNEALITLVTNCRKIEELELGWCMFISSEAGSFAAIAKNISNLKKLYLTSNRSVTDSDLMALARMCPYLEQLDILGAPRITAQSVLLLLQNCTNLKMLDLSFCSSIDRKQILQWTDQFPHCSILVSYQDQLFTKA